MTESKTHCSDEYCAYQSYLLKKEEWPYYNKDKQRKAGADVTVHQPFLIMELHRLVPYVKDKMVCFHPLNMPYVKIGKIEIVGVITGTLSNRTHCEYQVEDGTGTLTVSYKKDRHRQDRQEDLHNKKGYQRSPRAKANKAHANTDSEKQSSEKYSRRKSRDATYERYPTASGRSERWMMRKELLRRKHGTSDYLHASGYLTLSFNFDHSVRSEFSVADLSTATPKLLATSVRYIRERDYNRKLQTWISSIVAERYACPESSDAEHSTMSVDAHKGVELSSELPE